MPHLVRTPKLRTLTVEQKIRRAAYYQDLREAALSTAPAPRAEVEAALATLYRMAQYAAPTIIWVDSPLTAVLAWRILFDAEQKQARLSRHQVSAAIKTRLRDLKPGQDNLAQRRLNSSLSASLAASLDGCSLPRHALDRVAFELGPHALSDVTVYMQARLFDRLIVGFNQNNPWAVHIDHHVANRLRLSLQPNGRFPGGLWLAPELLMLVRLHQFCIRELDLPLTSNAVVVERLDALDTILRSCAVCYTYAGLAIACERPLAIQLDAQQRLHHETAPAVRWRDGWTLYAAHGVAYPAWLVEQPDWLSLEGIIRQVDPDLQLLMIERFGWDRFAEQYPGTVLDDHPRWGTLHLAHVGHHRVVFVRVVNRSPEPDGSFRRHTLPVDELLRPLPDPRGPLQRLGRPQKLTARNAVASTFGMTGAQYEKILGEEA